MKKNCNISYKQKTNKQDKNIYVWMCNAEKNITKNRKEVGL